MAINRIPLSTALVLGIGVWACGLGSDDANRNGDFSASPDNLAGKDSEGKDDGADTDSGQSTGGQEGETEGGDGCTLTQGYWKNHNVYRNADKGSWPIPEDTDLCGKTWYDILWTETDGDAWYILAHQWIAASLNVAAGVTPSADIGTALADAEALLVGCSIADGDRPTAIELSEALDAFNNGLAGVEHCGGGDDGGDDGGEEEGGDDDGGGSSTGGGDEGGPTSATAEDGGLPIPEG